MFAFLRLAKDVVKAVKKRLQHKNPKVQLLALTLLETMVKNCGDFVHYQIAEKNILGEMVKIVRKKTNMHVRDKILILLDSWQEAFGGRGGKHSQYYWSYEELKHAGMEFPQRSLDAAPIFTPPVGLRHAQAGYGMPTNSSRRLDETMATEFEGISCLSLSGLDSMQNVIELLKDMLQAINPDDRKAVKDEIIVDLVNRCRSNQKKLMQMLTTTGNEELLDRGLELNDNLQIVLAKHDAIASGSLMPTQVNYLDPQPSEGYSSNIKSTEAEDSCPSSSSKAPVLVANVTRSPIDEEEEKEDDFAQLARRHSKTRSSPSQRQCATKALVPVDTDNAAASTTNFPASIGTTKEQCIIDLLSITLSTPCHQPQTPHTPTTANQNMPQVSASSAQHYPYIFQTYPRNKGQATYNNYVVPWAQPQPQHQSQVPYQPLIHPQILQQLQPQSQSQPYAQPQQRFYQSQPHTQPKPLQQFQPQCQSQSHPQPQPQQHFQSQSQPQPQPQTQPHQQFQPQSQLNPHAHPQQQFRPQSQLQFQPQLQLKYPQYSSGYPPPPWAPTPGYANGQSRLSTTHNTLSTTFYAPAKAARPVQHSNSSTSKGSNGLAMNGDPIVNTGPRNPAPPGQKPFIPSYRLFEDLNVLGSADGRFKMNDNTSPSLSGPSNQGMVGGRK
ncbi:TOM1-like protein 6 isoform X3 [Manihot esculenta]|uniref:TOM1-like protein 6 isoform X3 n=1 Tax=Manihot esculenta TaxID=3983 RepID=UPI001CC7C008|nr:TOM1-like protein 6 isoform X3 [Manihot esculenta]